MKGRRGQFDAGDVVHLNFSPSAGHEMRDPHFALVVSLREFNDATGLLWVCPVSQGFASAQRAGGFLVTLMGAGTKTMGAIQVHQLRAVDAHARGAKRIERVPEHILAEVKSVLAAAAGLD